MQQLVAASFEEVELAGLIFLSISSIDGLLLFHGGSKEAVEEQQAGGRNVFAVRPWRERRRHDNVDSVLLCSDLLEILEGYHMYFLWSYP